MVQLCSLSSNKMVNKVVWGQPHFPEYLPEFDNSSTTNIYLVQQDGITSDEVLCEIYENYNVSFEKLRSSITWFSFEKV